MVGTGCIERDFFLYGDAFVTEKIIDFAEESVRRVRKFLAVPRISAGTCKFPWKFLERQMCRSMQLSTRISRNPGLSQLTDRGPPPGSARVLTDPPPNFDIF